MSNLPLCSEQLAEQVIIAVCAVPFLLYETWNRTPNLGRKKIIPFPLLLAIPFEKPEKCSPPSPPLMILCFSTPCYFCVCFCCILNNAGINTAVATEWFQLMEVHVLPIAQRSPSVHKWAMTGTSGDRKLTGRLQWTKQVAKPVEVHLFLLYQGSDRLVAENGNLEWKFLKKRDTYHQEVSLPLLLSRQGQNFNSSRCFELKQNPTPFLFSSHSIFPHSRNPDHRNAHHCLSN